jgi:multiple sugar transport system ATP-binding protein
MGFRPDALELANEGAEAAFPVTTNIVEELGSDAYLYAEAAEPLPGVTGRVASEQIIARVEPRRAPQKGEKVWLKVIPGREHFFSVKTGERLPG